MKRGEIEFSKMGQSHTNIGFEATGFESPSLGLPCCSDRSSYIT